MIREFIYQQITVQQKHPYIKIKIYMETQKNNL